MATASAATSVTAPPGLGRHEESTGRISAPATPSVPRIAVTAWP